MREGTTEIRVGVSACLLGEKVRFDGAHKHDRFLTNLIGRYVTFVPVCPELELGMGVPREAARLQGEADAPRMIGVKSGEDWTDRMNRYSKTRVAKSDLAELDGYVLKRASPSCGMERVKVYGKKGIPHKNGRGLFAEALMQRFPHLPVEEEGRLNDAGLRENFISRLFAHARLRQLFAGRPRRSEIIAFHSREKYLLMAHSPEHYRKLGRLVARVKEVKPSAFRSEYCRLYMAGLGRKATASKQTNVLQHILGHLRDHIDAEDRQEILGVIDDYRQGLVPLIVPVTLLGHFVRKFDVAYVRDQIYLAPHPKELMLRNHV